MSTNSKFKPLKWDCENDGCFNKKKRLKFGVFADCLPGKISFTDVDGLVEVNSNLLFLEWKAHTSINTGQRILFEKLTLNCPATVFIVEGDAETMQVESVAIAWNGEIQPSIQCDLDGLCERLRKWVKWANWNCVKKLKDTPVELPF